MGELAYVESAIAAASHFFRMATSLVYAVNDPCLIFMVEPNISLTPTGFTSWGLRPTQA